MGRKPYVNVARLLLAFFCTAYLVSCGGGAPAVVEPQPEAPAEVPAETPPAETPIPEQPAYTPEPQAITPLVGTVANWFDEFFPGEDVPQWEGEPDADDTIPPVAVLIGGLAEDLSAWGIVDLSFHAQDDRGVNLLALAVDGVGVVSVDGNRLEYAWDTFALEDGAHYLDILCRDSGFNSVVTTLVVEVKNATDNAPPVIDISSIATHWYQLSGVVEFSARATDDKGVTLAVVSLDGEEIFSTNSGEINFQFNTVDFVDGDYDLGITVYDALGNSDEKIRFLAINNNKPRCTLTGKVTNPTGETSVPCNVRMSDWVHPEYVHDIRQGLEHLGDPDRGYNGEINPADGSFVLSGVPVGRTQFKVIFGQFEIVVPINLTQGGEYQIPLELTRVPAGGNETLDMRRIGVVTGVDEGLEHTLAKLGYGEVDSEGALILGTEVFSLIDGDGSLPNGSYPDFDGFITNPALLNNYQTIFIASGNIHEKQFLSNAAAVSALKAWMEAGGTLYCGGTSYDFLEQLYPNQIDFGGADDMDGRGDIPEPFDAAMIGEAMLDAKISGRSDSQTTTYPYHSWVDWADLLTGNEEEHCAYLTLEQGWLKIDRALSSLELIVDREYPLYNYVLGSNTVTFFREDGRYNNYVSTVSSLVAPAQPSPVLTDVEKLLAARLYNALYMRTSH